VTAPDLLSLISSTRFRFPDEDALQRGLEQLFTEKGIGYQREVRLSARDRIDFMVGNIGVEVKIGGGEHDVERQLFRYAEHPEVENLILVTTRSTHQWVCRGTDRQDCGYALGKPVRVVYLRNSIF
jgi:hypothetical protein